MQDIRLYFLQSGCQRCKVHNIRMNQGAGADFEIPVPWFLLTHPKGNVVIDGGLAVEGLADPRAYWGDAIDDYQPLLTEDQGCRAQLTALNIAPETIRFVLLSHLHADHTGGIGRFPNATHIVQRKEYEYAFAPDWFAAGAYARQDFDKQGLRWHFLEGRVTDGYDLYDDGVLRMIHTPGHSVGHQSFLVTLPSAVPVLLAVDAAYTMDHWNERALPGFMASAVDAVRSVQKLRAIADQCSAIVVPGHDPDAWKTFKHGPEFYA
jgi:N-acyl homoserine lactone hydrolase